MITCFINVIQIIIIIIIIVIAITRRKEKIQNITDKPTNITVEHVDGSEDALHNDTSVLKLFHKFKQDNPRQVSLF